ncbi:unnamed protein product [Adineta ricciae]|uniref:Uncharacterized protein n=1 Tax=Adineta ricciae TaxID=249248 RepID=A0A813RYA5_ADIRI|nr:unnamed protein product [Adineta ricciae]CAF1181582.1 unnamed protein product [Adineta ricciae]
MTDARGDDDDSIDEDFFSDRTPEFDEARRHKQAAINHHAKQDDDFQSKKKQLNSARKQFEQKCNETFNANDLLLNELEKLVQEIEQLQTEKQQFHVEEIDQNTSLSTAEIVIDNCNLDRADLERRVQQQNNLKKILSKEYEQLEKELWNIRDKEATNAKGEDYLQSSLKSLQEQISRTVDELDLNEKNLADQASARDQCDREMNELRRDILENEMEIQNLEQEIAKLNQEKRILELTQADLQKQQKQSEKMISELERIVSEKEQGLAQSERQIYHLQENMRILRAKLQEFAESIQTTNSKLEINETNLIAAEQKLNTLILTRKEFEEARLLLKRTSENLEDQRIKTVTEVADMQEKLRTMESLIHQTNTNIRTLEQQMKEQSIELQTLRSDQENSQRTLTNLTNQSDELSELKDEAVRLEQQAKKEYTESEQKLIQLRDVERQHKIQYEKALSEEKRLQGQLQQAKLEQQQVEEKLRTAEARTAVEKIIDSGWKLLGSIDIIGPLLSCLKEDLPKAEVALNEVKTILGEKKKQYDELRKSHDEAKGRTAESKSKLNDASTDFQQQQTVVQQKETSFNQHKLNAEQFAKQYRDTLRQKKQIESNLHLIDGKLQRIESEKIRTMEDLQHHMEEQTSYKSQRKETQSNIQSLNKNLERQDQAIRENRMSIDENRIELINMIQGQNQQQNTINQLKSAYIDTDIIDTFFDYSSLIIVDEITNLKASLVELANAEKSVYCEITHQQTLFESERKSMEELRTGIENKQLCIRNIEQDLMNTTTELNGINNKLTNYIQKRTDIQQNIVTKGTALISLKQQRTVICSHIQTQNAITESLRRKLDELNLRDKQVFDNVQHLKDKINIKLLEIQKNDESIDQIAQKIHDIQKQQEQSKQIIITSKRESEMAKQKLHQIDQELADREQKYRQSNENLRQLTVTLVDDEQNKTNIIEKLKRLEKVIADNRIASCERKQEYELKAIAIIKSEKEKWKNAKLNNSVAMEDNQRVTQPKLIYNRRSKNL